MNRRVILADIDLCYGCFACEIACKQEHSLPVGQHWMHIVKVGPKKVGGKLQMYFYPMHCRHCSKPACLEVCPADAITKRADGIVLISEERCIGCLECMEACPFGAIEYNANLGIVGKCNLCFERIEQGNLPACVYHCPTGALQFGMPNELILNKQKMLAEKEYSVRS